MSNVKVVSSNTIIKKVVVGTPVPQVAQIRVVSDLGELQNVNAPNNVAEDGQLLIYNPVSGEYDASILLDKQTIDAGEGF